MMVILTACFRLVSLVPSGVGNGVSLPVLEHEEGKKSLSTRVAQCLGNTGIFRNPSNVVVTGQNLDMQHVQR